MSRYGNWMQTYTGRKFYPLDPRPEDIDIMDIAHCLARMCRYSGHTKKFYSVAEHSVLMAEAFPQYAAIAILHDAAEAFFGDLPKPIKVMIPEFKRYENYLLSMIYSKFTNIPFDEITIEQIEQMDLYMLWIEKSSPLLMGGHDEIVWDCLNYYNSKPVLETIQAWDPVTAEQKYSSMIVDILGE
jgi:hypothetical protein